MLEQIKLGHEGLLYVEEALAHGNSLMCSLVSLPLRDGMLVTFASDDTNYEKVNEFRHGGVTVGAAKGLIEAINDEVARLIASHLRGGVGHYAIFEDYLREPESKFLAGGEYFVYKSEVCLFVPPETKNDLQSIKATLKKASRYTFRGVLTCLRGGRKLMTGETVDLPMIQELAQNTEYILVGAYDEESYIIWTMREGSPTP